MSLKETCSILPTISSYTGHFTASHSGAGRFPGTNSPGPADTVYSQGETPGYVTAASPQPNTFPAIPINRVSRAVREYLLVSWSLAEVTILYLK